MKFKLTLSLLISAALVMLTSQSHADVIYNFVTDQATYNVMPGGMVSVDVYLQETLTGSSLSELVAQDGLFSFDVVVDVASAPSDPAVIVASTANADFNGVVNNVPPMIVIADRDPFEADGVQPTMVDATTYRVLLATFTIEGGNIPGETTTFNVADYENPLTPGADENTLYWDDVTASNPLDGIIGPGGFTVTVIPEPASLVLLGIGGLLSLRRHGV